MFGTAEEIIDVDTDNKMIFDDLFTRLRRQFRVINGRQELDDLLRLNIETWDQYQEPLQKTPQGRVADA